MKERQTIVKMLSLITQVGLTMIVAIFLCGGIGYWIDNRFGTNVIIWFLLLGIASGYSAAYSLIKSFISEKKESQHDTETKSDT